MAEQFKMGDKVSYNGNTYIFFCYVTYEIAIQDKLNTSEGLGCYLDKPTNENCLSPRPSQNNRGLDWYKLEEIKKIN